MAKWLWRSVVWPNVLRPWLKRRALVIPQAQRVQIASDLDAIVKPVIMSAISERIKSSSIPPAVQPLVLAAVGEALAAPIVTEVNVAQINAALNDAICAALETARL